MDFTDFAKGINVSMKNSLIKGACDLHTHSFNSDGTYSPSELIDEAERIGLYAIALTDHNTIDGLTEFLKAAEGKQVKAIPGVEFSTDYKNKELHIIALFVGEEHYGKIQELTLELLGRKEASYKNLCKALSLDGINVDYEKIKREAHGMPNRAHIAEALTKAGYTKSIKDAFNTLLSKDGRYYKEPTKLDVFETIKFIKSIGAVAVLAHPLISIDEGQLHEFLPKAKKAGLDAMETIYHAYTKEQTELAKQIANQYGILESGGSDFHGERRPNVSLGVGEGELFIDKEIAIQLKKRANSSKT